MGQSVQNPNEKKPTTVNDHIRELVVRLLVSLVVMGIAGTVVFFFYEPILAFLSSPLGAPLYYSNPAGSFSFVMKICLTGALIIAIPILIFNIIMFIKPAFEKTLSMKRILGTTAVSTFLAISGAAFAFYIILPGSLKFFKGFQVSGLHALISADSYLSFITNMIIMFVLVFQIPLLIIFVDHIKPLKPIDLVKKGKWVVIGAIILTIIQPFTYDVLTSLLIALPIIGLYYLSVVGVVMQHARERRKEKKAIHAVVAKPAMASLPQMTVDDLLYESMLEELSNLEKPAPIPVRVQRTAPIVNNPTMDFKKPATQPKRTEVAIPAWVLERKARQQQFSKQVNVFSDIIRKPNVSHA
ncbi:MAG: twin-arginine translocase subunit TatC [Candidatus Saccharibacteria bacterium]|nr:twin-arginine translocase subunit TatC [Candidatus Saccharibacteria bacterium]